MCLSFTKVNKHVFGKNKVFLIVIFKKTSEGFDITDNKMMVHMDPGTVGAVLISKESDYVKSDKFVGHLKQRQPSKIISLHFFTCQLNK